MRIFVLSLIVAFSLFGCESEDKLPTIAEDNFWEVATPSSQQMDEIVIDELETKVRELSKVYSFLIIRNGKIIHEQYQQGVNQNSLVHLRSVTKRIVATLTGIAIHKSHLDSSKIAVSGYFPEISNTGVDPEWKHVTVYQLLHMISGMDWIEVEDLDAFENNFHDPLPFIFGRKITHTPETIFSYNSPGTHLLSYIIERSSQQKLTGFAEENLFEPLGIKGYIWESDGNDVPHGGAGLQLTARNLAKIGLLYLQHGAWEGQQLLSPEWIAESLYTPVDLDTLQGSYLPGSSTRVSRPDVAMGNTWWTMNFQGETIHYGDGFGGQILLFIPKYELIVVMNRDYKINGNENIDAFNEFFDQILPLVIDAIE